jgi:hypothetical protein
MAASFDSGRRTRPVTGVEPIDEALDHSQRTVDAHAAFEQGCALGSTLARDAAGH